MKNLCLIIVLLIPLSSINPQELSEEIENRIRNIENGLMEFVSPAGMLQPDSMQLANPKLLTERMKHYNVPGLSIALVNKGKVEWLKTYGISDAGTGAFVSEETVFQAASTSKFVTAILALHFVENGIIDIDENVNSYLKSWKVPDNEFTIDAKVTLRRVLTHQAGLPTTNFNYDDTIGYPSLIDVLEGKSPALNKPAIPELIPGTQWQYSNVGYNIVQLLLEDLTGKPFPQLAYEIIFEPLGMNSTSFYYPLDEEFSKKEAMPHDAEGNAQEPAMHLTAFAHGGVTTTPFDLAIFTNEIMLSYHGDSEKILSKEMVIQLFTNQCDIDPRMFGFPLAEGLGVLLLSEGEQLCFAHPGHNLPGTTSWLIGWPNSNLGVVVMTNSATGDPLSMEIISAIINEYLN